MAVSYFGGSSASRVLTCCCLALCSLAARVLGQGPTRFAPVPHPTISHVLFLHQVGQYLSSRGDVMPAPWISELSKLQDAMPFRKGSDVRTSLEEYYGKHILDVFETFDEVALASASIAQVHRATLKGNNQKVVLCL